jgi:hypothetical protein
VKERNMVPDFQLAFAYAGSGVCTAYLESTGIFTFLSSRRYLNLLSLLLVVLVMAHLICNFVNRLGKETLAAISSTVSACYILLVGISSSDLNGYNDENTHTTSRVLLD